MKTYPFEVPYSAIRLDPEPYVDAVFSCLESEFLVMPRGKGFISYDVFEQGYEALKKASKEFSRMDPPLILRAIIGTPISFVVLRAMLGFTPPEWAYVASQRTGVAIDQGAARTLDRSIRLAPLDHLRLSDAAAKKVTALIVAACELLSDRVPPTSKQSLHRLDKADTRGGLTSLRSSAQLGIPYAMLLYERFLGRPFAGHRDSVSELIGDTLEVAIEEVLVKAGIGFKKTKRAEKIDGFDQAPDFIIPDQHRAKVVIEAKITEDDGTARDKVTRIQHLGELSGGRRDEGGGFEVIACIGGRGFGVRREDMRKMLLATRGKVFTLKTLDRIVDCTRLKDFRTR